MISISSDRAYATFLLMINSKLLVLPLTVSEILPHSLKLSIKNCDQTAADGNIATIESL